MTASRAGAHTAGFASRRAPWAWLAAFGLAYGAAQFVDLWILPDWDGIPAVDLAAGLAAGAMVRARPRWIMAAVVIQIGWCVGLAASATVSGSMVTWVAQQVLPALSVALIVRVSPAADLTTVARLGMLAGVAIMTALAWAIALSLLEGVQSGGQLPDSTWIALWWSQAFGLLLLMPGLLAARPPPTRWPTRRWVETAAVAAAGGVSLGALFAARYDDAAIAWAAQWVLVPVFLWIALRLGMVVLSAALVLTTAWALWATDHGTGPLAAEGSLGARVIVAELAVALIGMAAYVVAMNEERRRRTEARLLAARRVVDSIMMNSDARITVKRYDGDGVGTYTLANPRFAASVRRPVPSIVGRSDADLFDGQVAAQEAAQDQAVLSSGASRVFVTRRQVDDGTGSRRQVLLVTKFPLTGTDGRVGSVGAIALDITEHRRRERLMRLTFDQSPIPMARLAWRDGRAAEVLDANISLAELLDAHVPDLVGTRLDRFVDPSERGIEIVSPDGDVGGVRSREIRIRTARADEKWVLATASVVEPTDDDGPEDAFALVTLEDITARRVAEQTLTHQALHDSLTGVLNRYALLDRLAGALNRLWREPSYVAVLFCDLDGFKHMNDTLGHRAGDQMLINVSERLRAVISPQNTLARLGGDEFVMICEGLSTPGQASVIGERIRAAMRAPFPIEDREYGMTVSVGIAATTDPNTRAEDLLRRADLAMYRAKDAGRNRVEYYAAELEARAVAEVEMTEVLRRAIDQDRICVHFQPIIDLRSGRAVEAEALVRIVDDGGALVRPGRFIEVAERSGLVVPLGERVLDLALDELVRWQDAGLDLSLSVNVSPRQLSGAAFAPAVFERLLDRSLSPGLLTLEVTEGAIVEATGPTLLTLRRLRSYGIHVSIDDFGTGYSSLMTLKHLPADVLKIDRSFVEGLGVDSNDAAIVSAVIRVAHDTGRAVVAEGVENGVQEDALRGMNCDRVQGFRYGRPVSGSEFCTVVRS